MVKSRSWIVAERDIRGASRLFDGNGDPGPRDETPFSNHSTSEWKDPHGVCMVLGIAKHTAESREHVGGLSFGETGGYSIVMREVPRRCCRGWWGPLPSAELPLLVRGDIILAQSETQEVVTRP